MIALGDMAKPSGGSLPDLVSPYSCYRGGPSFVMTMNAYNA